MVGNGEWILKRIDTKSDSHFRIECPRCRHGNSVSHRFAVRCPERLFPTHGAARPRSIGPYTDRHARRRLHSSDHGLTRRRPGGILHATLDLPTMANFMLTVFVNRPLRRTRWNSKSRT
ncbi:hypothetical protein DIE03_17215 [Burkholderia sp. Bp8992]|nr:hypothetical protein DIE03_17215 [Burkholderia sp. Bp8992]